MSNDRIDVIYGESYDSIIQSDDETAVSAVFYVGKAGELPVIEKPVTFTDGEGQLELEPADTRVPLGVYNYMIKVEYEDGRVRKFPRPDCDDCKPVFEVHEAIDETEIVS